MDECLVLPNQPPGLKPVRPNLHLGEWHQPLLSQWSWIYDSKHNTLYHKEGPIWIEYTPRGANRRRYKAFTRNDTRQDWKHPDPTMRPITSLPLADDNQQYHAASVNRFSSGHSSLPETVYFQVSYPANLAAPPPPAPTAAMDPTLPLPQMAHPMDHWATSNIITTDEAKEVAESIQQSKAMAVSDGSYKDSFGTASLVIEAPSPQHRVLADLTVPGDPRDQIGRASCRER